MFKSMNLTFNKVGSYEADLRDNVRKISGVWVK